MKDFAKYSRENIHFYDEAPKLLRDLLARAGPGSLADFGCGDGATLFDLKRRNLLKDIDNIFVIDLSPERLERVKNFLPEAKVVISDASCVKEISSSSLDLVICSQLIEHVANDENLLKEISRVLKVGGHLYISSVVKKWYGWYFYRCNGSWVLDPTHLREYRSVKDFCRLLSEGGFQILDKNQFLFKPSPFNILRRCLIKYKIMEEEEVRKSRLCNFLAKFKIPTLGYYIIEVIAKK